MKMGISHIDMDQKARHEMIDWLLEKAEDIDFFYYHSQIKEKYFTANY